MQRMPMRSRFISEIRNNGGRVVQIEKQADYIIADHVRTDVPAGSLSYRFIEQALRDGRIPSEEAHTIRAAAPATRGISSSAPGTMAIGSSAPVRNTRTQFTHEEDVILTRRVMSAKASGSAIKGNSLYDVLAAEVSIAPVSMASVRSLTGLSIHDILPRHGGLDG